MVAFNLVNYAAGLTHLRWRMFLWTTGVGILPMTFIMVLLGDNLEQVPQRGWLALAMLGIISWFVLRALRRRCRTVVPDTGR